jgi:hypothetical protein
MNPVSIFLAFAWWAEFDKRGAPQSLTLQEVIEFLQEMPQGKYAPPGIPSHIRAWLHC